MNRKPIEIKRLEGIGLRVRWDDGTEAEIKSEKLRRNCPCAECREKRGDNSHAAPLSPTKKSSLTILTSSLAEEISLESIWPVGNYALGLKWADGHSTGIYTYQLLAELGVEGQTGNGDESNRGKD